MIRRLHGDYVIPIPTRLFTDPTTDSATKAASPAVFIAIHQFGRVVLGEPLGQFPVIGWAGLYGS